MCKVLLKRSLLIFLTMPGMAGYSLAQSSRDCLAPILTWENQLFKKKYQSERDKMALKYHVTATDQDGEVVNETVRVYRNAGTLHFFSDQADIFQDKKNMFLILHRQKIVFINDPPQNINTQGFDEAFLEMRQSFLDNCTILQCGPVTGKPSLLTAELKSPDDLPDGILIDRMKYTYETKQKKLLSTEISYKAGYKLKKLKIEYTELNPTTTYDFGKQVVKYVFDEGGKLLPKYRGYQIIDNR